MANRIQEATVFEGAVTHAGGVTTKYPRSQLTQETLKSYFIPPTQWRVWNALQTNLPGTAADDDLAIISGTFGTDTATLRTSDAKATSVTQYARAFVQLPPEYEAGETVVIRVTAHMVTTVSDGTATVDVEAYEATLEGGLGGSPTDLCTTSATSINSLDWSTNDFTITSSGLAPGDILDIRIGVAITDAATGTAVIGEIGAVEVLCDIRG